MKLTEIAKRVEKEMTREPHYSALPRILEILKKMILVEETATEDDRKRLARGVGYLVLDNFEFSESELGGLLLVACDEFAQRGEDRERVHRQVRFGTTWPVLPRDIEATPTRNRVWRWRCEIRCAAVSLCGSSGRGEGASRDG